MRSLVLLAFLILLAPLAAAQVPTPPSPTLAVEITGAPANFPEMSSNATGTVSFNVEVTLANTLCPQGGAVPVTLAFTQRTPASFFSFASDVTEVTVNFAAPGPGAQSQRQSAPITLTATTVQVTDNASIPIEIIASASVPANCTPAPNPATSEPVTVFANITAPPPPPPPEPAPEKKSFLPGFSAIHGVVAAAIGVAMMRRKK